MADELGETRAPRAVACARVSSTSIAAPSPMTKPFRRAIERAAPFLAAVVRREQVEVGVDLTQDRRELVAAAGEQHVGVPGHDGVVGERERRLARRLAADDR